MLQFGPFFRSIKSLSTSVKDYEYEMSLKSTFCEVDFWPPYQNMLLYSFGSRCPTVQNIPVVKTFKDWDEGGIGGRESRKEPKVNF